MPQFAVQSTYKAQKDRDVEFVRGKFTPVPDLSESYNYGIYVDLETFLLGGAAQKHYGFMITGDQISGNASTGDSNSAYFRVSASNYAANDANYILRGCNIALTNRSGGTMGRLENFLGVQNKSGGTVPILHGCTVIAENYGTVATLSMAMDIINRDENDTSRTYAGVIRLRNDDRSGQSALDSAIDIDSHASSGGFDLLIEGAGAVLTEYDSGTEVAVMSFQGANGTTYYLVHDTDSATVMEVKTSLS
jgi:hypothetical protein